MATITRAGLQRGDMALWDGITKTASRVDATGGTFTGLTVNDFVDVLQVYGGGTERNAATAATAAANIGSAIKATLLFATGTWTIDSNVTIPSNLTCYFPAGCVLSISNGVTFTASGLSFSEHPSSLVTGSGTAVFAEGGSATYLRTTAERAASITPTYYQYEPGDVRRYGWAEANTGAQNATALAAAASVWGQGGPHIRIPEGTFSLSQFTVPTGRGLIIEGQGPNRTKLVHSTSGSMFVLGADNIQLFKLRDIYLEPSASSSVLLDWSGNYQAYAFRLENVEMNEGSSGNNSCVAFNLVGGSTPGSHEKHYFTIDGLKIFGMGTGINIDGTTATCNDLDARGVQIQGCADDGIILNDSYDNRIHASVENCGDGVSTFCLQILGTSAENRIWARLENTISPSNLPFNFDATIGKNNYIHATLSATPATSNDLCIPGGIVHHFGLEFADIDRRNKGLHRQLGDNATDIVFVTALSADTMGGRGRFGIEASGKHGWADSASPSGWDAEFYYEPSDGVVRLTGKNFRAPMLEMTDGVTAPAAKPGFVQLFVDTADGDLKVIFGDGTTKTIVVDT